MPLFCGLGWHRPRPVARWNNGYYFTKCSRCGRDLVRTAYGGWHEPKGFRVVWQAEAPVDGSSARLVRKNGGSSPELPIQEVLRHLQNGDGADSEARPNVEQPVAADSGPEVSREDMGMAEIPNEEPAAEYEEAGYDAEAVPRAAPSVIPDFMDDSSAWKIPIRPYVPPPAMDSDPLEEEGWPARLRPTEDGSLRYVSAAPRARRRLATQDYFDRQERAWRT